MYLYGMNGFGNNFRVQIFGESHGKGVGITIDGCPAGLPLAVEDFSTDMKRRQGGNMLGTTPRKEADEPVFLSGVFNGFATGAPLTIFFENANTKSADYEKLRETPRPGHADFVASKKFNGFEDYRGGGHFSGRLTACLVAAGVVAKKIVQRKDNAITCEATLIEAGGNKNIEEAIQHAIANNDSIGGIVECVIKNLPIGLGEPFFNSIESAISQAVFAIPAIKGIEFGSGFAAAKMLGSQHNDAIISTEGKTATNHAGGIVGGITNGNDLIFRVAVKPTSSTPKPQQTLNLASQQVQEFTVGGRHDLCIALRVPVVVEAVASIVLVDMYKQINA
jgi:chorismate synthase